MSPLTSPRPSKRYAIPLLLHTLLQPSCPSWASTVRAALEAVRNPSPALHASAALVLLLGSHRARGVQAAGSDTVWTAEGGALRRRRRPGERPGPQFLRLRLTQNPSSGRGKGFAPG